MGHRPRRGSRSWRAGCRIEPAIRGSGTVPRYRDGWRSRLFRSAARIRPVRLYRLRRSPPRSRPRPSRCRPRRETCFALAGVPGLWQTPLRGPPPRRVSLPEAARETGFLSAQGRRNRQGFPVVGFAAAGPRVTAPAPRPPAFPRPEIPVWRDGILLRTFATSRSHRDDPARVKARVPVLEAMKSNVEIATPIESQACQG